MDTLCVLVPIENLTAYHKNICIKALENSGKYHSSNSTLIVKKMKTLALQLICLAIVVASIQGLERPPRHRRGNILNFL